MLKFDPNDGFFLNSEHIKLKGVCNHHDLGAPGTAINVRALERRLG
jgi:beta-galactosidase